MAITFQRFTGSGWATYGTLQRPTNLTKTLTTEISSITVNLYFPDDTEDELIPGTIVAITIDAVAEYFVVIDGGKVAAPSGGYCLHAYVLQELLAITREWEINPGAFTHGVWPTPSDFFGRLFAMTEKPYLIVLMHTDGYAEMAEKWQPAGYQIASNMLLDNLLKIGQNHGVRFKATFLNAGGGQLRLTPYALKGSTAVGTINGTLNGISKSYIGENYASKVVGQIENLAVDKLGWVPSANFVSGARAEPENPYDKEITEDTAVVRMPFPIRDGARVKITGYGKIVESASYTPLTWYDKNQVLIPNPPGAYNYYDINERNDTGATSELELVSQEEWNLLDPDSSGGATRHQENTLYYERTESIIKNIKIANGLGVVGNTEPSYYYTNGGPMIPVYQTMKWAQNYYNAEVILFHNGRIEFANRIGGHRAVNYSQEENEVSATSLAANMQNHINSMSNREYSASYIFTAFANIPTLGKTLDGMVLHTIDITVEATFYLAVLKYSDDLVRKSEYLNPDAGVTLPAIPLTKAFDRPIGSATRIWICRTYADAYAVLETIGNDTGFNFEDYKMYILDGPKNNRAIEQQVAQEVLLRTGDNTTESPYVYTALPVSVSVFGNTILFKWQTIDNSIAGRWVDENASVAPADFRYYPVGWINVNGKCNQVNYKIIQYTLRPYEPNYPRITQFYYDDIAADEPGCIIAVTDYSHYHDPIEKIIATHQIDIKPYNPADTVHQLFLEECSLLRSTIDDTDTRYAEIDGTDYEIDNVQVSYTGVGISTYKIWLITGSASFTTPSTVTTRIKRITATLVEEPMLDIDATIKISSGFYYLELFVAETR